VSRRVYEDRLDSNSARLLIKGSFSNMSYSEHADLARLRDLRTSLRPNSKATRRSRRSSGVRRRDPAGVPRADRDRGRADDTVPVLSRRPHGEREERRAARRRAMTHGTLALKLFEGHAHQS
jgi:hypothetical protein